MTEKKGTLISLKIKTGKKSRKKPKRYINHLKYILTDSITEPNDFIYTGTKLISDEFGILQRNPNINTKAGWEMRQER